MLPGYRLAPTTARSVRFHPPAPTTGRGGLPEWPKGADCKSVGSAYEGSNPSPATPWDRPRDHEVAGPIFVCPVKYGTHRGRPPGNGAIVWSCHAARGSIPGADNRDLGSLIRGLWWTVRAGVRSVSVLWSAVRGWSPDDGWVAVEEVLAGGNVAGVVVRVGDTVRKPATAATPAVFALLGHLNAVGYGGAPRVLGLDDGGRQVLEFVPGRLAHSLPLLDDVGLRRVGRLVREFHDAVADFRPPVDACWDVVIPPDRVELVCHHDLAPWNLVIDGDRWVFIDWDGAGPGSRLWDLAYAAHGFVGMRDGGDPDVDGARLRAIADGYDLDGQQRAELPELIWAHIRGMFELLRSGARTGTQPWARLYAAGHADHWGPAADYAERHAPVFRAALLA